MVAVINPEVTHCPWISQILIKWSLVFIIQDNRLNPYGLSCHVLPEKPVRCFWFDWNGSLFMKVIVQIPVNVSYLHWCRTSYVILLKCFVARFHVFHFRGAIMDCNEETFLNIRGPCCPCRCCVDMNFDVSSDSQLPCSEGKTKVNILTDKMIVSDYSSTISDN